MPAVLRSERAKSVTLYLSDDVIERIAYFADQTVRSKSQSAEYLIKMGMDQFLELRQEAPEDAPQPTRKITRRGKPKSVKTAVSDQPRRAVTQPAPEVEEAPAKPARKPRAKKPAAAKKETAKKPAARKTAARKPRKTATAA